MRPIPQVWADLPLREYADEFGDECLRVLLNPTLELVNERGAMLKESARMMKPGEEADAKIETLNERMFVWLSKVMQGITLEEIRTGYQSAPDFVMWLVARVSRMMDEHRDQKKKVSKPRLMQ